MLFSFLFVGQDKRWRSRCAGNSAPAIAAAKPHGMIGPDVCERF